MATAAAEVLDATGLRSLRLDQICPEPELNPRKHFDQTRLEELAASIAEDGVQEPLLVRPRPEDVQDGDVGGAEGITHWIYAGERRWRAAKMAGLEEVPCIVRDVDRKTALRIALVENLQRADLTQIEEARGIRAFMDANPELTQAAVGEKLGYSQAWVANRLRLLKLPELILDLVQDGAIMPTSARDHLLPWCQLREDLQPKFWKRVVKKLDKALGKAGELPLSDDQLVDCIRAAGMVKSMSRPTSWKSYDYTTDDGQPKMEPEDHHEGCDCNAPGFRWGHHSQQKSVRCFDVERWEEIEAAAKERKEAQREATREKDEEKEERTPEERLEILGLEDRDEAIPRAQFHEKLDRYRETFTVWFGQRQTMGETSLLDPGELDPETIVRVEGRNWKDERVPDDLICLDPEAEERAQKKASETLQEEYTRRRRERGKREAEEVDGERFGSKTLALLLSTRYPAEGALLQVLEDLELFDSDDTQNQTVYDLLSGLDRKEVFRVAKIIELRIRRGDICDGWQVRDPLLDEIKEELRARYTEKLQEIAPGGALPSPADLEEEDEEEAEPEKKNGPAGQPDGPAWKKCEELLEDNPDASVEELYDQAKAEEPGIGDLTLRQFNARVVLQIKRRGANEKRKSPEPVEA